MHTHAPTHTRMRTAPQRHINMDTTTTDTNMKKIYDYYYKGKPLYLIFGSPNCLCPWFFIHLRFVIIWDIVFFSYCKYSYWNCYWYCFHHDTIIQRKCNKKKKKEKKCRHHKITGLPSCWFYFAGIVNQAGTLHSASLVKLAICTKTIYQDYNNLLKCLCIPFMQLVINFRFYSHRWAKKLQGMVALVHMVTIGLGQIFIEDCKPFL